jgi:putative ABC transport system permease protein
VRLYNFTGDNGNFFLRIGEKVFEEKRVFAADSNFFRVFSVKTLKGDAATALMKPNSVVINETTAKKYFGSVDARYNKTFETDGNKNNNNVFQITAFAPIGRELTFSFDILISTTGFDFTRSLIYQFCSINLPLLNPGYFREIAEVKISGLYKKICGRRW